MVRRAAPHLELITRPKFCPVSLSLSMPNGNIMGENLKVFWAKFSTLNKTVFVIIVIIQYRQARPHLELKTRPRFSPLWFNGREPEICLG